MSRANRSRQLYEGCYAHIISRSIRKEKIFLEEKDFKHFLSLLKEAKEKYIFNLFHYCLMQTHFHFVVQVLQLEDLSRALNFIKKRYVIYYHSKYRLNGPIWRERYKSLLIEDTNYLYACGQYVEYNPVKAGIVSKIEDWEYSSAMHYLKLKEDFLINQYQIPMDDIKIDYKNVKGFEEGDGIGSDYFKFSLRKSLR
jgi:putative transposase